MQHRKYILIFGGYSHKNRGDLAMLLGIIKLLSNSKDPLEVIVHSINPDELHPYVNERVVWSPEVYFCSMLKWKALAKPALAFMVKILVIIKGIWFMINFFLFRLTGLSLIRNRACIGFYSQIIHAKALILSGGGYINSLFWLDNLFAKAFVVITAKCAKVSVLLTSQGIGPFNSLVDTYIAKLIFKYANMIGVRDEKSAEVVKSIYLDASEKIVFTGDDSLLLTSSEPSVIKKIFDLEEIPLNEALIGANIRDSSSYTSNYSKPNISNFTLILDEIVSKSNRHLIFIPISYSIADDDRKSAQKIVDAMRFRDQVTIIHNEYSPSELRGLVSKLHFAIGTSYHFLLFALSSNVPSVGVYQNDYYKQKIEGLFSLFDMEEYCLDMNVNDLQTVLSTCNKALQNYDRVVQHLISRNEQLTRTSMANRKVFEQKFNV